MLYLCDLLRNPARPRPLLDLAFDALDGDDYPAIREIIVRLSDGSEAALPFARARLHETEGETRAPAPHLVWLKRDVLDALVLDLQNRRATRANDVVLRSQDGCLRVVGVDVGGWAVLRRLSRGRFGRRLPESLYDWRYVEFLRGDPMAAAKGLRYRGKIANLPAGDIAALCSAIPYLHAAELLRLLPAELAAETLQVMDQPRQLQVFEELGDDYAVELLARISPHRVADLLVAVGGVERIEALLNALPEQQQRRVLELLHYPNSTAGALMTNDVVSLDPHATVAQARAQLQTQQPRFVYHLYVVEGERLLGTVPLKELLRHEDDTRISSIMSSYTPAVRCDDAAEDAAFQVIRSHLPALPVVGEGGRFLGAITADTATAKVLPRSLRGQLPRVFV